MGFGGNDLAKVTFVLTGDDRLNAKLALLKELKPKRSFAMLLEPHCDRSNQRLVAMLHAAVASWLVRSRFARSSVHDRESVPD